MPTSSDPAPYNERQVKIGNVVIKTMSRLNTFLYRISGGRVGGRFSKVPVCLLTTVGRKSGEKRTMPLLYMHDGSDVILVASKGGFPTHPQWYLNLVENPDVDIQIGKKTTAMVSTVASSDRKAELWPALVRMYPDYDEYQAKTDRDIPVVVCSPVGRPGA